MAYKHGVYISEQATSILPPVSVDAGIPFIVGTAPVGMVDDTNVNKPVICYTYAEAVAAFGFVPAEKNETSGLKEYKYSICEQIYAQFALFGVAPVVIVNVLDPATHKAALEAQTVTMPQSGSVTVKTTGIIKSTVAVAKDSTALVAGTDYELAYDDDGFLVISAVNTSYLGADLTVSGSVMDPTAVDADDIIGGVSTAGVKTGLELIADVFPRFGVVPGTIVCPGYSDKPAVAAVMAAKCDSINGLFRAISVIDVPTATVTKYADVQSWKNTNNVTSEDEILCWPLLSLDGTVYHMSTQAACLMALTDSDNDDVPYVSPSNQALQCTATVLADGSEVWLDLEAANYLNGIGCCTAHNFIGGWKFWGNRAAIYPSSTDVKDAFIPIRRMFNWIGNTLVQTYWSRVDFPLNRRQIDTIVDSVNIWLNGLSARQYIVGGRVEFDSSENPTTSLLDGIATFHLYVTPPAPNREIEFVLEYDVNYLSELFA